MNFLQKLIGIVFLLELSFSAFAQDQKITLENIYKERTFRTKGMAGMHSLNDGEHYLRLEEGNLNTYSYKTGEKTGVFVDKKSLLTASGDTISMFDYALSSDEKLLLIPTETEAIYRHSNMSNFYIWNRDSKTLSPLSVEGKQRIPQFSQDEKKVAFVRDNNLFIKDLISETETKITHDGEINKLIYGTTDWVYEEEFGFTTAFFWSPDGKYIAYYRFDESHVKEYQMTMYGDLYPEEYTYKYPVAGEDNSLVDIYIYDVAAATSKKVNLGAETDQYIPRIYWTPVGNQLAIYKLNRLQNNLQILLVSASDLSEKIMYQETNKYYIDINGDFIFTPDGKQFLLTSEKDGYNRIYLYNIDGKEVSTLTPEKYDVSQIIGFDETKNIVYYQVAESAPYNREVYGVDFKGKKKPIATKAGINDVRFSKGFNYYIHIWSDANTPQKYTLFERNGKEVRVIEDNAEMQKKAQDFNFIQKEFFQFTTSEGVTLNGWMIKPKNYDPSKKYPTFMYVYGGPGSQTVLNNWRGGDLWHRMLAQDGFLVVSVDNRGTGFRGEEFKKMTYQHLGKYEAADQIETAKYLINKGLSDPNHIAIFGWSYGGYMSSLCMTLGADYFTTGIAVAPVTSWRYYDNIYTERFMRTPQENPSGYDDFSPITHAAKMRGNYLLVHGTADDNVHVQNTIDMVSVLVDANVNFEMFLYPNSNHGIYTGKNTTYHLYQKLTKFLKENAK